MIPKHADRATFIVAMIKNSQDLLSDASLLLASGRDARAFVLSVLAQEEAGKALLVLAQEIGDLEIQERQLTSHRGKLLSAGAAAIFLIGDPDRVSEEAQGLKNDKTHEEKMAGLYVDWRDGQLQTPDCIGPERAAEAFANATKLLDRLGPILGSLTPETLGAARLLEGKLWPALDRYVEEAGVGPAVELARQLLAYGSGPGGGDVDHE